MYRVSLGVPVYNGESFLCASLESILRQTFDDFELVISDNASTDATQEICRTYSALDNRIRYFRNNSNYGVVWNHNRVLELSTGKYFKWCGADDLILPTYISRCVDALEMNPSATLCYTNAIAIDQNGVPIEKDPAHQHVLQRLLSSPDVITRFSNLLRPLHREVTPFHGVIRLAALRSIPPHRNFLAADRCLLAELSILGPFICIPEQLFYRRSNLRYNNEANRHEISLYKPGEPSRFMFREWRVAFESFCAIRRAVVSPHIHRKLLFAWLCWILRTRETLKEEIKGLIKHYIKQYWYNVKTGVNA